MHSDYIYDIVIMLVLLVGIHGIGIPSFVYDKAKIWISSSCMSNSKNYRDDALRGNTSSMIELGQNTTPVDFDPNDFSRDEAQG